LAQIKEMNTKMSALQEQSLSAVTKLQTLAKSSTSPNSSSMDRVNQSETNASYTDVMDVMKGVTRLEHFSSSMDIPAHLELCGPQNHCVCHNGVSGTANTFLAQNPESQILNAPENSQNNSEDGGENSNQGMPGTGGVGNVSWLAPAYGKVERAL
jgi:hypothetical protein